MSATCNCGEHVKKLNQQVSVMRKEIKNLRQLLDSGVRSHRKHMTSLQSALRSVGQDAFQKSQPMSQTERGAQISLEQGHIQTAPIGYISSCFSVKNGTPRQPTVCGPSRATLQIQQRVFNNAEHSLVGLEDYSHVWVIFLFHKNGHLSYKAKVKPPRLNGQRVGVYSTRSPHRPNALGLTLAKLDRVTGDTLHLSEIDMIAGTPVLDIKPYIPDYDSPHSRLDMDTDAYEWEDVQPEVTNVSADNVTSAVSMHTDSVGTSSSVDAQFEAKRGDMHHNLDTRLLLSKHKSKVHILSTDDTSSFSAPKPPGPSTLTKDLHTVLGVLKAYVSQGDSLPLTQGSLLEMSQATDGPKTKPSDPTDNTTAPCYGEEAYSTIAGWIRDPPVASLDVRFTLNAKKELEEFLSPDTEEAPGCEKRPRFRFLQGPEEATAAIRGVLSADPRSVYRRTRCKDRLFFFTLDTADITCWFGQGFTEVLRITPVVPKIGN